MKHLFFILLISLMSISQAQNESTKAKFIIDLTKSINVNWPDDMDEFNIVVLKNKELFQELNEINNRKSLFRNNTNIRFTNSLSNIDQPDILYVNQKDYPNISIVLAKVKTIPCLVVGENYPFQKSMINFVDVDEGEVSFEVNENLIKNGIEIRRSLLRKSKNSMSESQWAELLNQAQNTIKQQQNVIQQTSSELKSTTDSLDKTNSDLSNTKNVLSQTETELEVKTDSLTYSQLLNQKKDEALLHERRIKTYLSVVFVLVLVILFFIFNNYQKNKKHNAYLAELNQNISQKNTELKQRNKEILDSIRYAERIQKAMLPSEKLVKKYFEQSFIFFKPKDIVSGDFYWMETIDDTIVFAAVDCTGHGVPGAFMSVLGHDGLNRIIKENRVLTPAPILNLLNEFIEDSFNKSGQELYDGMDIALCALNMKHQTLQFAGANNPLYLIRDKSKGVLMDGEQMIEPKMSNEKYHLYVVRPDKQPIGKHHNRKHFTNYSFELKSGDSIYVFSDGYADQFGGPDGKKFKYKQFKKLLLTIQDQSMEDQLSIVENTFEEWKNHAYVNKPSFDQIDDVVIIGVKV